MTTLPGRLAAVAALGLLGALTTAPAALATPAEACSEYAQGCDSGSEPISGSDATTDRVEDAAAEGTAGGAAGGTAGRTGSDLGAAPDSLPLTGGEAVLLALGGTGALAAGTALVVASRRRAA